jgi:hypothetical protein
MRRALAVLVALSAFAVAACGTDNVDTAAYTCGEFNKSLKTKGDDTAGNYINQLRKDADLGQDEKVERREITLGIIVACRGESAKKTPADEAIATAKKIKAGKFKLQAPSSKKKKSGE